MNPYNTIFCDCLWMSPAGGGGSCGAGGGALAQEKYIILQQNTRPTEQPFGRATKTGLSVSGGG